VLGAVMIVAHIH